MSEILNILKDTRAIITNKSKILDITPEDLGNRFDAILKYVSSTALSNADLVHKTGNEIITGQFNFYDSSSENTTVLYGGGVDTPFLNALTVLATYIDVIDTLNIYEPGFGSVVSMYTGAGTLYVNGILQLNQGLVIPQFEVLTLDNATIFTDSDHWLNIYNSNEIVIQSDGTNGSGVTLKGSDPDTHLFVYSGGIEAAAPTINLIGLGSIGLISYDTRIEISNNNIQFSVSDQYCAAVTINGLSTNSLVTGIYLYSELGDTFGATIGLTTIISDALAPAYLQPVNGGGTVMCRVMHNGVTWVAC